MKRSLWILSQPRVGSMLLCELLNHTGLFGYGAFQERFFHEPFFLRGFQFGKNASSIRLDSEVLWLGDVEPLQARKFRRIMHTLLHGGESDVDAAQKTAVFAEYRTALYAAYRDKGLPEFLKIHRRHHFAFIGDEVLSEPCLRHHFENKDYIVLDRTDRIMQTVSLYIAFAKRQFIVTDDSRAVWNEGEVPYDESYMLILYDMLALAARRDWTPFLERAVAEFGARVAYIDYSQMLENPDTILESALCNQLGLDLNKVRLTEALAASSLRTSTRPENKIFAERLRAAVKRRSEQQIIDVR